MRVKLGVLVLVTGCGLAGAIGVTSALDESHPIAGRRTGPGNTYYPGSVHAPPSWMMPLGALTAFAGISGVAGILAARSLDRRTRLREHLVDEGGVGTGETDRTRRGSIPTWQARRSVASLASVGAEMPSGTITPGRDSRLGSRSRRLVRVTRVLAGRTIVKEV